MNAAEVRRLQARLGVAQDGIRGPATWAALGRVLGAEVRDVRSMQRALGVAADGIEGPQTMTALWAKIAAAPTPDAAGAPPPLSRLPSGLRDPAAFYAALRGSLGRIREPQVEGFDFLLGKMGAAGWPIAWTAYGLATAWHETANRMQPVREGLDVSDAWRRRNLRYYPHYGRGYPQTTWEENYRKADEKLGLGGTLVANPDRMLEPEIAAATMIRGMEEGWFSGDKQGRHTLRRHLPSDRKATREEFRPARRIINIMDKADKIAGEALAIQTALEAGGWGR